MSTEWPWKKTPAQLGLKEPYLNLILSHSSMGKSVAQALDSPSGLQCPLNFPTKGGSPQSLRSFTETAVQCPSLSLQHEGQLRHEKATQAGAAAPIATGIALSSLSLCGPSPGTHHEEVKLFFMPGNHLVDGLIIRYLIFLLQDCKALV